MKLRLASVVSKPAFAGIALLSAVLVAGLGIGVASPETMVARSFTAALGSETPEAPRTHAGPLVAGTEEFWLDQKRKHDGVKVQSAAWAGSGPEALGFAVGDHISISSGGGATRVLEVVSISELPAAKTQIEVGPTAVHAVMVTCRDTASADGQLVTFETSVAQPAPAAAKHPQAL
jgi:hypothetical protein